MVVVLRKALDDTLNSADPSCELPPEPSPKAHCSVVVAADATDTADGGLTHVSRIEFQRRPNLHPVFQGGVVYASTSVFHMRADPGRVYTLTPAHDKPGRELMYGLSIFASTSTLHCEELGSSMPGWYVAVMRSGCELVGPLNTNVRWSRRAEARWPGVSPREA